VQSKIVKLLSKQLSPVCYFFPLSSKYHIFSTWSSKLPHSRHFP